MNTLRPCAIWLTGLSGSGKTTIATALNDRLRGASIHSYVLDGDRIRRGLCQNLGYSELDRRENIRRISEVASLLLDANVIPLVACISPFRQDRDNARRLFGEADFFEVYVDAPLTVCEQRDVKGLYAKARQGLIKEFTGISSPYEVPEQPDLVLMTHRMTVEQCVDLVMSLLQNRQLNHS